VLLLLAHTCSLVFGISFVRPGAALQPQPDKPGNRALANDTSHTGKPHTWYSSIAQCFDRLCTSTRIPQLQIPNSISLRSQGIFIIMCILRSRQLLPVAMCTMQPVATKAMTQVPKCSMLTIRSVLLITCTTMLCTCMYAILNLEL
jgi:ABC-type multidrug transport system permease subunit